MTTAEALAHHRLRAFRDPDGPAPAGIDWTDPLERVAIHNHAVTWGTPADVLSDMGSPKGRERLDHAWAGLSASTRATLRTRAAGSIIVSAEPVS